MVTTPFATAPTGLGGSHLELTYFDFHILKKNRRVDAFTTATTVLSHLNPKYCVLKANVGGALFRGRQA